MAKIWYPPMNNFVDETYLTGPPPDPNAPPWGFGQGQLDWAEFLKNYGLQERRVGVEEGQLGLEGRRLTQQGELTREELELRRMLGLGEQEISKAELAQRADQFAKELAARGDEFSRQMAQRIEEFNKTFQLQQQQFGLSERQFGEEQLQGRRGLAANLMAPLTRWYEANLALPSALDKSYAAKALLEPQEGWKKIAREGLYSPSEIGQMATDEATGAQEAIRSARQQAVDRALASGGRGAWLYGGATGWAPDLASVAAAGRAKFNARMLNKQAKLTATGAIADIGGRLSALALSPTQRGLPSIYGDTENLYRRLLPTLA